MKVLGKVVFFFAVGALILGCSMNGQVLHASDTHWSSYYQAMHDKVAKNNPEMDHVLTFCNEMVKIARQYESHAISNKQFTAKQQEMRKLLQREDEYRRTAAWRQDEGSSDPMEQYLQAKYGETVSLDKKDSLTMQKAVSGK